SGVIHRRDAETQRNRRSIWTLPIFFAASLCLCGEKILFRLDRHRSARVLPSHAQLGLVVAALIERNRERISRLASLSDIHRHASEIVLLARIRNAPLTGFLADDQRPLVLLRQHEQRVGA